MAAPNLRAALLVPWIILAVVAMLLWALLPFNPYGYYVFLRWVVCLFFLVTTVTAWSVGWRGWALVLGAVAILYNPISKIPLSRGTWNVVNVLTVLLIFAFIRASRNFPVPGYDE